MRSAPAFSAAATCSPRRAKSAAKMEGAILIAVLFIAAPALAISGPWYLKGTIITNGSKSVIQIGSRRANILSRLTARINAYTVRIDNLRGPKSEDHAAAILCLRARTAAAPVPYLLPNQRYAGDRRRLARLGGNCARPSARQARPTHAYAHGPYCVAADLRGERLRSQRQLRHDPWQRSRAQLPAQRYL